MSAELPFRTLAPWLRTRYGRPVRRVALDAGSSCPNRDGTKGFGGCVYCDVEGSGTGALRGGHELAAQLEAGLAALRTRDPSAGAIAYFQSYSNTYVDDARLAEVLSVVEPHLASRGGPVVAVSVATRPDTLPEHALARLADLGARVDVWVELGLEAADDEVLRAIRRFHTVAEFVDAVGRVHAAGLLVVGHAILGLPGDQGALGARRTADALARSGCAGVKVHNLIVLRRTQLEKAWRAGELAAPEPAEYVEWLADFVERLAPDQVLHRLTADASDAERLAPGANLDKNAVRERLAATLAARGTSQGSSALAARPR